MAPEQSPTGGWGDYAADAVSVNTVDWACIRQHEDSGTYSTYASGAYGFEPATALALFGTSDARGVPPSVQDAAALKLFAENGDHFRGTWNNPCTLSMGLR